MEVRFPTLKIVLHFLGVMVLSRLLGFVIILMYYIRLIVKFGNPQYKQAL